MNTMTITVMFVLGACSALPTESTTSSIQGDPLRWPVGNYSCVTQYSTVTAAHSTFHVAKATYVVAEDFDAETQLGDGTVVLTGRYDEFPLTLPLVAAAFTETWRIDPKLASNGNASYTYEAQFDDLRRITGVSGTFLNVAGIGGFLGFASYHGGSYHFPGVNPGGSSVGLEGVDDGNTFDGPVKFGRNWRAEISRGVFQQFYDQECTLD